ncbi:MAG TPA: D-aminoacyl-tRNA deacylase [Abditibacteriaceae bacterium]|nr:D-aminoacyl-tRNA deacylase [Abditibacteriaceae bacterium]
MKAVIQRCHGAQVEVEGNVVGQIGHGLVVFLGVAEGDDEAVAARLAQKIATLRIFDDAAGKFAFSVRDKSGAVLVISNFTVCGDARKGTRPDFTAAAPSAVADHLYNRFVKLLAEQEVIVQTGVFGAAMRVQVANDGPVTVILEVAPPGQPDRDHKTNR